MLISSHSIKKFWWPVIWGLGPKNYKDRRILMKKIANFRKMATSFRRKKHQDERASEASDFLSTQFQICTKHFLSTQFQICTKQFYVSPDGREKGHQQPLRNRSKLDPKFYFFPTHFQFKSFQAFFTFNRFCMTKSLLWIMEKCVLSRNTDYYKVWDKFQL